MNDFEEITQMRAQAIRVSMEGGKLSSIVEWICLDSWTDGELFTGHGARGQFTFSVTRTETHTVKCSSCSGEINV